MRIAELTLHVVRLNLKRPIVHASASRTASENIFVRCRLADGTVGWGEGVPRAYVTGETAEGGLAAFGQIDFDAQLDADCASWADVIARCAALDTSPSRHDPRGCGGNALRCAIELSLLDAFGRLFGEPVSRVTHYFEPARELRVNHEQVRYSTTITGGTPGSEWLTALKMRCYGFAQCKVKVGMQGREDAGRLRRIRRILGQRIDLRLDANEAWGGSQARGRIEPLLPFRPTCVEQPVPHAEVDALAELRRQVDVPIMLDESLTGPVDAERAIEAGTCDLFNIRLSKCGGFLRSLELAARAREAGLGYQLGCHPGESPILSAAGRHWATSVRDIRYLEGSYDRHLLKDRLACEDMTFGYGGRAPALSGPGLGVTIDPRALERVTVAQETKRLGWFSRDKPIREMEIQEGGTP